MPPVPPPADVLRFLPAAVARELPGPEVDELLAVLLGRGWRPAQLRQRVGALPVQASAALDAAVVTGLLRQLADEPSPQARWAEERASRERDRADARLHRPRPAAAPDRDRWIAAIRRGLKSRPPVPPERPVRPRPVCAVCGTPSEYFVRRDVHLCARCVDVLAAGAELARRRTGS